MKIETLHHEVQDLTWLNGESEEKHAKLLDKYRMKKQKISEERIRMRKDYTAMEQRFEGYINNLQKVM